MTDKFLSMSESWRKIKLTLYAAISVLPRCTKYILVKLTQQAHWEIPISSLQGVAQEVDSEVLRFGDVVLYKYRFPRFPAWQRLFITAEWIKKAKGKSFKSE